MHDIKRIREFPAEVKKSIGRKGLDPEIEKVTSLDRDWRAAVIEGDNLKAEMNIASKAIGIAKKAGNDATEEMQAARNIRERIASIDDRKKELEDEIRTLLLSWPAEPDAKTPEGLKEKDNVVIREAPSDATFDFEIVDHLTLANHLGLLDMDRGAKITGTAFPVYTGDGASLERALINFMLDLHIREHGYKELFIPFVVNRESVLGTGQLPKLVDDMYQVEKEDFFLIPTADVPITNLHRNELLNKSDLPLKYTGYSACFRREAGTYGAETRGLLRIHQFNKVEMVQFVEPDRSEEAHQEILSHATRVLDLLKIPYRVLELCAGELSFAASRCFDIEVWSPAAGTWLEASSVSNFKDFQSRRMNLRYKPEGKGKPEFPHTLNGSGLATSRLMVALLENYQTPERRVMIPKVLQPYLGGLDQIRGG